MPKVKTKKSITRRFRVTKKGKVMRLQGFRRHLNEKKSSSHRRRLQKAVQTKKTFAKRLKKALGK